MELPKSMFNAPLDEPDAEVDSETGMLARAELLNLTYRIRDKNDANIQAARAGFRLRLQDAVTEVVHEVSVVEVSDSTSVTYRQEELNVAPYPGVQAKDLDLVKTFRAAWNEEGSFEKQVSAFSISSIIVQPHIRRDLVRVTTPPKTIGAAVWELFVVESHELTLLRLQEMHIGLMALEKLVIKP